MKVLAIAGLGLWTATVVAAGESPLKFDFGPGPVAPGYVQVLPGTTYSDASGYGFEPGATVTGVDRLPTEALANVSGGDSLWRGGFIAGDRPFFFSLRVPEEGNYCVTVTLGDAAGSSGATIKAELRRLMVENLHTAPGRFATVRFIVNTRSPKISAANGVAAGEVRLKAPRESIQEAWAWDNRITLEFDPAATAGEVPGAGRVCLDAIEVTKADVPTIFLLGDSTVCDQSREPYTSWGQMLTRFFKPEVAIANHAESGETYRDSIGRRRLDKVISVMKPGDYLFMQFGHNDQKQIKAGTGGPFTTYQAEIKTHVDAVRAVGGIPVIVSPMERRNFDAAGKIVPTLADYAAAARQTAQELHVAFIDLHAMSIPFYEALGPENSKLAFAQPAPDRVDNTHHDNYGAYELAQCIVQGIRDDHLEIAKFIVDDFHGFDPAHPDPVGSVNIPPSPLGTSEKPLGN